MAKKWTFIWLYISWFIMTYSCYILLKLRSYPAGAGKTPIRSQGGKVQEKTCYKQTPSGGEKARTSGKTLGCPLSEREPVWQANTTHYQNASFCINRAPPRAQTCRYFCLICDPLVAKIQRSIDHETWGSQIISELSENGSAVRYREQNLYCVRHFNRTIFADPSVTRKRNTIIYFFYCCVPWKCSKINRAIKIIYTQCRKSRTFCPIAMHLS